MRLLPPADNCLFQGKEESAPRLMFHDFLCISGCRFTIDNSQDAPTLQRNGGVLRVPADEYGDTFTVAQLSSKG